MNVFRNCITAALLSTFALSATILNAHAERGRLDTFTYKGRNYLCKRGLILWISPSGVPYCDKPAQRKPAPQPVTTQPTQPQAQPGTDPAPLGSTTVGFSWQFPDPVACVKRYAHSQNPLRGPIGKIIDRRIDSGRLRPVRQGIPTAYAGVQAEMQAGLGQLLSEIYSGLYQQLVEQRGVVQCSLADSTTQILPKLREQCSSPETRAKYAAGVDQKCAATTKAAEKSICFCLKPSTIHFMEQNCLAAAQSPQVLDYIQRLQQWCKAKAVGNLTRYIPKFSNPTAPNVVAPPAQDTDKGENTVPPAELPRGNGE